MTIEEFATRHRVRPRRDTCNEEIIPGRPHKAARQEDRSHVYDHGDGQHFGLALMLDNSRKWTFAKQRLARLFSREEARRMGLDLDELAAVKAVVIRKSADAAVIKPLERDLGGIKRTLNELEITRLVQQHGNRMFPSVLSPDELKYLEEISSQILQARVERISRQTVLGKLRSVAVGR
jgi:hypothetical protein